jgi:hypothetical protein
VTFLGKIFVVAEENFGRDTKVHGVARGSLEARPTLRVGFADHVEPIPEWIELICLDEQAGGCLLQLRRLDTEPVEDGSHGQVASPPVVVIEPRGVAERELP